MNIISFFSGCGGLDLGFHQSGYKILYAMDNSSDCKESHETNFKNTIFELESIQNLSSKIIRDKIGNKEISLVIGGSPCPPFSKSRFYRKEKPQAFKDILGWETVSNFFRLIGEIQPEGFVFENVAGFAYKKNISSLDYVLNLSKKYGYECTHKVINTANYGIPQIRERFILVGLKSNKFIFPEETHTKNNNLDLFDHHKKPWVKVGDVLNDIDTEENASDKGHFAGGKDHELLKLIPPGENYLFFTKERDYPNPIFKWRSRYWSFLLKLSPDKPSWTIQARRSNNMGPFHWRNRILRIDEIKRIQTFPDNWILKGSIESQWRQIGNAVPPLFSKILANKIKEYL